MNVVTIEGIKYKVINDSAKFLILRPKTQSSPRRRSPSPPPRPPIRRRSPPIRRRSPFMAREGPHKKRSPFDWDKVQFPPLPPKRVRKPKFINKIKNVFLKPPPPRRENPLPYFVPL